MPSAERVAGGIGAEAGSDDEQEGREQLPHRVS
jgi:hypothetical protein